ncbi:HAD family phosphatase [Olsenella sp. Marseille-P4559]|uniref:HAD family hydrolase n=1 Tax=Olsenella sp. Marseille-P4559 TaxID=2364795 RepID=UPI0013EEF7EE|nr:HAD family phosphatase [Olsenella sp. Marseille-P4559]
MPRGHVSAVLFDMDGLTLDTESIGYEAYLRAGKRYGFQVNERLHMDVGGRTEPEIIAELRRVFGDDKDIVGWRAYINEQKDAILRERGRAGKKPGLLELICFLNEMRIPYALASSTKREKIHQLLATEHLIHAFPVIVSGDMVTHGKPDPEIFEAAATRLGVAPPETLVLEDSRAGIEAARAGGFQSGFIFDDVSRLGVLEEGYPMLVGLPDPHDAGRYADYKPHDLEEVIAIIKQSNT